MNPNRSEAFFYEKQRFDQIWLISLMVAISILPIAVNLAFFVLPNNNFNDLSSYFILLDELIYFVVMGTFSFTLLFIFKLETIINNEGIFYRLYPINVTFLRIDIHEINNFKIVEYNPIGDFGGWGIRFGKNKKAYTTSGKKGIEFQLNNKKDVLLGTKKTDEFEKAMKKIITTEKI
jgi:hypothetical protein